MKKQRHDYLFILVSVIIFHCTAAQPQLFNKGLALTLVDNPPAENVVASYTGFDKGGNTSIAFDAANIFKWSGTSPYPSDGWGYFDSLGNEVPYIKRDRDLGQTFHHEGTGAITLKSITLKTGYGNNVVRPGMYGRKISIQLFEVSGEPVLDNNGTDITMEAFHGFPHNRPGDSIPHMRDDYYRNEVYKSIGIYSGAVFPSKKDFGFPAGETVISPDHALLKGRYLKFAFPAKRALKIEPGKRYAFLVMIDEIAPETGFTLANNFWGNYSGGHAIRRDGNGVFPPAPADPDHDFTALQNKAAMISAHFPSDFKTRTAIPPGTNGYPDVDTFRDFVFFIEAK